jgi:hypothetical protein
MIPAEAGQVLVITSASDANDHEVRTLIDDQVPMGRLGPILEFALLCRPFVDGSSGFATGQFVAYSGGWA